MPLTLKIAVTHLNSRRRQTLMSLLGVMLGVAFFMAVSSLMRGSEQDFIKRLVDSAPHITVSDEFRDAPVQPAVKRFPDGAVAISNVKPKTEVRGIRGYKQKMAYIEHIPGVRVAPVLSGQIILTYAGKEQGVLMNGVVPELMAGVSDIEEKIVAGNMQALSSSPNGVIIGRALAKKMNLEMGDNVTVSSPVGLVRTMKIVGLFETGATAIDEGQAYVLLKRAQVLLDRPDRANMLVMQLDDPYASREVAARIEKHIGYRSRSWQEASESLLSVLLVRNIIMYSVVSAILVVASFGIYNIISTVVMEKRRDIAILKSMGFTARDVRHIFLWEGTIIGLMGSVGGLTLGYGLIWALSTLRFQVPGVSVPIEMPVYWGLDQALIACAFAALSAMAAAYFPARKAGLVHPVDILRGQA
jgi:lipoprotein-releasing system permease protein